MRIATGLVLLCAALAPASAAHATDVPPRAVYCFTIPSIYVLGEKVAEGNATVCVPGP